MHAGDMTDDGKADSEKLEKALGWIIALPHKLKVIIPGETPLPPTIYIPQSSLYPIIFLQEFST